MTEFLLLSELFL